MCLFLFVTCSHALYLFFFFFSSRRRHTRLTCDWSSDVCSSDLAGVQERRAAGDEGLGLGGGQLRAVLSRGGLRRRHGRLGDGRPSSQRGGDRSSGSHSEDETGTEHWAFSFPAGGGDRAG